MKHQSCNQKALELNLASFLAIHCLLHLVPVEPTLKMLASLLAGVLTVVVCTACMCVGLVTLSFLEVVTKLVCVTISL